MLNDHCHRVSTHLQSNIIIIIIIIIKLNANNYLISNFDSLEAAPSNLPPKAAA